MTKIDDWAGVVNEKLIKLGEVKPSILVEATWASMGYYEATVKDILTYKLGDVITFKPNKDNDGTTTLKVNLLEPKFLMKYATDGSLINLNERDLRINHEYQFRFEGTHWVWQDGSGADQTNVDGVIGNILSVSNDNTISDSGVSVEQVATNKIDIESIRANKADKTYVDTQDSLKVDKSQIKNNLTETVEGNVIDATQGKILDDKINVLSTKIDNISPKQFGIKVDLRSDTIVRLGDAIGKSLNDFENYSPWNGQLVVVEHQHMKKIPLFYYKRVPIVVENIPKSADNNEIGKQLVVWEDWVSVTPMDGYYIHPAFIRGGRVVPYIYFSRFEGSIFDKSANTYLLNDEQVADFNNDLLCSIPNAKPCSGLTQNLTIEMARKLANNRSTNSGYEWFQQDFTTVSAIQILIAISIGSYDSQVAIGQGVVNITDVENTNCSLITGSTLDMGMRCGSAGENGKSSVNYFGIENFWGNIWKFFDGINIECKGLHQGWISNDDLTINTSANKTNLGFTISKTSNYMSKIGYNEDIDFAYIPSEAKGGKVISKDYLWQNSSYNGFLIALLGGSWNSGAYAGCFCWFCNYDAYYRSRSIGARLACIKKIIKLI